MPKDGVYVGEDSHLYPCFDSEDYMYEPFLFLCQSRQRHLVSPPKRMSEATKEDYAAYRDDSRENYMEVIESLNGRLEHLHYLERIYSRNGATVFNCIRLSLADHNPKTAEDKESYVVLVPLTA